MDQLHNVLQIQKKDIRVGLIVRLPASDGSVHPFNDCVIEGVDSDWVSLARPYVTSGSTVSAPFTFGVERYRMSIQSLLERGHTVSDSKEPAAVARSRGVIVQKINEILEKDFDLERFVDAVYESTTKIVDFDSDDDILSGLTDLDLEKLLRYLTTCAM